MSRAPRTERVKRERFMPFRFERAGLTLTLKEAQLDDEAPFTPDAEEAENGEVHLEDDRWEVLTLRLSLAHRDDLPALLVPEEDRSAPHAAALIVAHEPRARLRRVERLDASAGELTFRLTRHELAGPLTLTPWLVRTSRTRPVPGYAHEVGQRLATGRALTVHPYAARARPGHFLEVQYKSFADDPQLRNESYRVYFLDLGPASPVLLVNADHPEVVDALDAKAQAGVKARLREVFYDVLSIGVWTQLFMHATEALSDDGSFRHPWQEGVLAELLPQMFPRARQHGARVAELLAVRNSDHALSQLSELCDRALQQRLDLAKHMQRLVSDALGVGKA